MSEIKRLMDQGTPRQQALLTSALEDDGDADCAKARARTLAMFGAGAGAIAAAGAVKPLAPSGALATTKLATLWIGASVLAIGAIGVVGAIALHVPSPVRESTVHPSLAAPAPSPTAAPTTFAAIEARSETSTASPQSKSTQSTREAPRAVIADRPRAAASVAPSASPSENAGASPGANNADDLTAEITAIEDARRRWKARDAEGVLSAVAAYRARFPNGALAPEAAWLAANARVARAEVDAARAEGDALRARDPKSPYVARIEQLTRGQ